MSKLGCAILAAAISFSLFNVQGAFARQPKKYQATGTVLEVTTDFIAIDKGGERWEIGRDANTKITGSVKVGGKVTVEYQMSASRVEASDAKGK